VTVVLEVHKHSVEEDQVSDVREGILAQKGKTLIKTFDMRHGERVSVDMRDPAYKTLYYNLDTQYDALSDEHTNIHPQQSNNRILRTTSIRACALDYTHARIHKHLPSCTNHVANAYKRSLIAHVHEDELEAALEVENSEQTAAYASGDIA